MTLDAQIEAVLFFKGEPISLKKLCDIFDKKDDAGIQEVLAAIGELERKLVGRGLVVIKKDDEFMLGTSPDSSSTIEMLAKEDLTKDIGKAGLETLSIVLYRGPVTRREIDYIRGVNSTFILRNLLVRGLVEKIPAPNDQRSFLYRPTFELLNYIGLKSIEELPEYAALRAEVEQFEKTSKESDESSDSDSQNSLNHGQKIESQNADLGDDITSA